MDVPLETAQKRHGNRGKLKPVHHGLLGALGGAILAHAAHSILDAPDAAPYQAVVAQLQADEAFRAHYYRDTRGVLTIGYGTNLDQGR